MFPLSPAHDATLNRSPSPRRFDGDYEVQKYTVTSTSEDHIYTKTCVNDDGDTMSSPLVSNTSAVTAATAHSQKENGNSRPASVMNGPSLSPVKDRRHSRVISGTELSPLKILNRKRSSEEACQTDGNNMGPPPMRSARKISSPEKRFPVKIGSAGAEEARDRQVSLEEATRTSGHLQLPIDIFEDEEEEYNAASRPPTAISNQDDGGFNPDDTMASTFSTFSAVPTLTSYANWRAQQSPAKLAALANMSSSRPSTRDDSSNTTNLLMDFTDSLRHPRRSPEKKLLPSSSTMPNLIAATPSRAGATTALIDFDIPPLPTPRSMPSISSRELESLKSGFLSEISSLKASLSGKEAEVQSLKTAVADAEKRVGESLEKLREESAQREQATAEKEDWQRRGREMENVLHKLRDEIVHGQQAREETERKLEESEKRREAAEMMHQEAESKIVGLRAGREIESDPSKPPSPGLLERQVERVARELHGLYKTKHLTKVAALKRSYQNKSDKKVEELERRVLDLCEENASLQAGHPNPDDTLLVAAQANAEADKEQANRDRVAIRELNATVQRLEAVVSSVQGDNQHLHRLLEQERVEKGELVQLAEEMMSMQSFAGGKHAPSAAAPAPPPSSRPTMPEPGLAAGAKTPGKRPLSLQTTTPGRQIIPDGRRGSVGKASGLRAPGSAYRGGATAAAAGSGIGNVAGLRIPGSRSGILSSIEKMGSHRGRGQ